MLDDSHAFETPLWMPCGMLAFELPIEVPVELPMEVAIEKAIALPSELFGCHVECWFLNCLLKFKLNYFWNSPLNCQFNCIAFCCEVEDFRVTLICSMTPMPLEQLFGCHAECCLLNCLLKFLLKCPM